MTSCDAPGSGTPNPRRSRTLPAAVQTSGMGCGFVPPYLLRHLAAEAHPTVAAAEHPCGYTLRIDASLRERRERATPLPGGRATATAVDDADRWVIYSAGNEETLPGTAVRADGDDATGDVAADEAFEWTRQVWDLYEQRFERRSYDGAGSTVTVTVHFGQNYDNAFWDGEQLVFGDGDGEIFERFTKPADVLAHEFSHGVVQYTSEFTYNGQPGALNESIADVFASMSIQHAAGQTADQASWLIGEGLFKPGINATALRSMLAPGTAYDDERLGKDPQVGSMAEYVDTTEDNGGVHLNSGIPNRAFALAATTIGGHSWEQTGRVWYEALTSDQVGAQTDFEGFAQATVDAATRLFPETSVPDKVRAAWVEVGLLQAAPAADAVSPGTPIPLPEGPAQEPNEATSSAAPDAPTKPRRVAVRRSGGFTGQVRRAEIDLDADERAEEVRRLLGRLDLQQLSTSRDAPDRFVYTVEVGDQSVTLGEQDLPPDLQRVVQIVLGSGGSGLPGLDRDLG
ncbi:MAG TPA: protealysin inhibitor emfourin [Microlunatus sp.]|nr:protealysin inhibitor emfourin [Microlunatus sp.]